MWLLLRPAISPSTRSSITRSTAFRITFRRRFGWWAKGPSGEAMPEISDQPGPSAQIPDSTPPPRSNGELWMETGVVLALGVLPDLFYAISVLVWPELSLPRPFAYDSLSLIVRASAVSVPVLYLIWRSGENWSAFGLERPSLLWDSVIGVMIWVMDYLVCFRLWGGVSSFLPSTDALNVDPGGLFSKPRHAGDYILLFISSCTN